MTSGGGFKGPRLSRRGLGYVSIGSALVFLIVHYFFPSSRGGGDGHEKQVFVEPSSGAFAPCQGGCEAYAIDGDTMRVKTPEGSVVKVRLYGCDAPETEKRDGRTGDISKPGQPFGEEAFTALKKKIKNEKVTLDVVAKDRYGRAVAVVRAGGRDLNMEMVRDGMAECYREYLKGPRLSECIAEENKARQKGLGVWSRNGYERPSDFRKRLRIAGG